MYGEWEITIGKAYPFHKGGYAEIKKDGDQWKILAYNKIKKPIETAYLKEFYYDPGRCHIFRGLFKDSAISLTVVVARKFSKGKQIMIGAQVKTEAFQSDNSQGKDSPLAMEGTWGAEEMG